VCIVELGFGQGGNRYHKMCIATVIVVHYSPWWWWWWWWWYNYRKM